MVISSEMKSILSIKRNCTTATSKYDTDDSVKPPPQPTTNKKVNAPKLSSLKEIWGGAVRRCAKEDSLSKDSSVDASISDEVTTSNAFSAFTQLSATATKSTTSSEVPEASSKPNECLVTSLLRKEEERAKAKRDFANKRRKEALLYLRQVERSIISNESSEGDEIKLQNAQSKLSVARSRHIETIQEEQRLSRELKDVVEQPSSAGTSDKFKREERQSYNTTRGMKHGEDSDHYTQYKQCDSNLRSWLSSVSIISLEPLVAVDDMFLSAKVLHDEVLHEKRVVEIPKQILLDLDDAIELREGMADVMGVDKGHKYFVYALRKCREYLKRAQRIRAERERTTAVYLDEEVDDQRNACCIETLLGSRCQKRQKISDNHKEICLLNGDTHSNSTASSPKTAIIL